MKLTEEEKKELISKLREFGFDSRNAPNYWKGNFSIDIDLNVHKFRIYKNEQIDIWLGEGANFISISHKFIILN